MAKGIAGITWPPAALAITVANLATSARTIVVDADAMDEGTNVTNGQADHFGPGDREFLRLVEAELAGEAREATGKLFTSRESAGRR